MKIPGFGRGLTQNLFDWKMVIVGTFNSIPQPPISES